MAKRSATAKPAKSVQIVRKGSRGRLPTQQQAVADFIAAIDGLSPDAIEARWTAERLRFADKMPATCRHYIVGYRKAVLAAYGPDNHAIKVINTRGLHAQIQQAAAEVAVEQAQGLTPQEAREKRAETNGISRLTTLETAAADLAEALRAAKTPAAMSRLWTAELARHARLAESTRKLYISRYYRRAIVDALGGQHASLDIVKVPHAIADHVHQVQADGVERVEVTNRQLVPFQHLAEVADDVADQVHGVEDKTVAAPAVERIAATRARGQTPLEARLERAETNVTGRKSTLQAAIADFILALRGARTPAAMAKLWTAEFARHDHLADRTRKLYVSQYYRRAIIDALGAEHASLDIVKVPADIIDRVRADSIEKVAASNRQLVAFPRWAEVVQLAARLLRSDDPMDIAVGLLVVTGRRTFEVFCTAGFAPAALAGGNERARSRWSVMFSGQSKTKGRPGTRYDSAYEIPVLAPASLVLEAHARLRRSSEGRLWDGMDNEEFGRLTRSTGAGEKIGLAQAVQDHLARLWPDGNRLTPKCLRSFYAEVAYRHFGPGSVSKNSYFSLILGHTLKDLETSLSYMDYYLPDDDGKAEAAATSTRKRLLRNVEAAGLVQATAEGILPA